MSIETLHIITRDEPASASLAELSVVRLLRSVATDEGVTVPAGSSGTIVATWGDGEAYEVEFSEPVAGLATVAAQALRAD